jgi:predicted AAA+ superfamily ATPase
MFNYPKTKSFFLLGPRGTGKSYFLRSKFPDALYIDLLKDEDYQRLLSNPSRLVEYIGSKKFEWIIIDEIQKIPALLDEVHRLIENKKQKFILTGSSARKLKRGGANLLAGRAISIHSYPFSAEELGENFDLKSAMQFGLLPQAVFDEDRKAYLKSYIQTYLREEILQEGLVRNIGMFARFLESASFSQGQVLNYTKIGSDCSIERKTVTNYFDLLEDLMLAKTLEVFSIRAKRELIKQRKFYFFDAGVFQFMRPKGPLDSEGEVNGIALETLILQELMARNEYHDRNYRIYYWRTTKKVEVDFILYGEHGLKAIEVKLSAHIRDSDLDGLLQFKIDYPKAELFLVYGGEIEKIYKDIRFVPAQKFFSSKDLGIHF